MSHVHIWVYNFCHSKSSAIALDVLSESRVQIVLKCLSWVLVVFKLKEEADSYFHFT